jgi:hypothetical protein
MPRLTTVARCLLLCSTLLCSMLFLCDAAGAGERARLHVSHSGRFQFVADFPFARAKEVGAELESLAERLWNELLIPDNRDLVRIYLFSTQEDFAAYVRQHIPTLSEADTNRTAMFLLRNDRPYIFAVATSELTLNLRHEFVHVMLNTSHEGLPIWLDEGLAEYYEVEDGNQPSFRQLLARQNRRTWQPNIHRLERLQTMSQMGLVEYAEGWSWVYLLMQGSKSSRRVIPEYLSDLRKGAATPRVSDRLQASPGELNASWQAAYQPQPSPTRTADRQVRYTTGR